MTKRSLCISRLNWVDRADTVITPSRQIVSLPATNLKDEDVSQVWGVDGIASGATSFHVDVEFLQNVDIGTIALVVGTRIDRPSRELMQPMMATTDKVRFYVDAKNGTFGAGATHASALLNCNIDPYLGYHVYHLPTQVSGGKVRVFIDVPSRVTPGFWWGARLWIGPRMDLVRSHQPGHVERFELNEFDEPRRAPVIPLQRVLLSEVERMLQIEQTTNTKRQILFTFDKTNANKATLIGKRESTVGLQSAFFQMYGTTMQIKETW